MALKTFNLNQKVYEEFSTHCKKHGISMSRKIENFIREELEKIKSPSQNFNQTRTTENPQRKYVD